MIKVMAPPAPAFGGAPSPNTTANLFLFMQNYGVVFGEGWGGATLSLNNRVIVWSTSSRMEPGVLKLGL